jgi:hypothetical protein
MSFENRLWPRETAAAGTNRSLADGLHELTGRKVRSEAETSLADLADEIKVESQNDTPSRVPMRQDDPDEAAAAEGMDARHNSCAEAGASTSFQPGRLCPYLQQMPAESPRLGVAESQRHTAQALLRAIRAFPRPKGRIYA